MKRLTLSKALVERKFNKLALVILLVLCFQGIKAGKLGDYVNEKLCSLRQVQSLSAQIRKHAYKMYTCENDKKGEEYENKLNEQQMKIQEIQKDFMSSSKDLKLVYRETGLVEYFLYKQISLREYFCGDPEIAQKLGNSYNDCGYCMGLDLCTNTQDTNSNQVLVESFQLLWNCNNPDNQVGVTGIYDEVTEKQLLQTEANGFDKICQMCDDQNCSVCSHDYSQCLECKEGYYAQENVCIFSLDNCAETTKEGSRLICSLCLEGFYLLEGKCVQECPSDYRVVQSQCFKCQPGTFAKGEICAQCPDSCQKCSGPQPLQCELCDEGFEKDQEKGCIIQDLNLIISFRPKQFLDPRTNTMKECNFSCDECDDSTDLCIKCNPKLNHFIKEGEKFKCYNRCPLYFEPNLTNQNLQNNNIECVKSESYTTDLQDADKIRNEAKNRCAKQQYWDIQTQQCYKCTNNCITCNDNSSCVECEPGYYWNDNRKTCSPCHPSCKKCTGPLSKNCLSCTSTDKLFPDANGICEESASDTLQQQNTLSQNELYGDLSVCKQFLPQNQQQSYSVEFSQKYSTADSQWQNIKLMSSESCKFQEFQNRYKYFQKNKQNCEDKEISQSTFVKNGDLVAIYSIILSQLNAQVSSKQVNPETFAEYAISKKFFSLSYIFKPTLDFDCSQLQCTSSLDSLLYGFSSNDSKKQILIKTVKDIILTSSKQTSLNCFQEGQQVNQNTVEEIEQIVNNSQYTLNTASKQYFILYLCGKSKIGDFVQKPLLVQKSLGNGFFEVLNVSNQLSSQVEVINLYGASTEQNAYLTNCDSNLSNSFISYQVQQAKIVQVVEQDTNYDKSELMFQQYNKKAGNLNINPSKCSCVETKDYILANENQGNQFITVITPQNKLLTQSIVVQSITHILKKHNIEAEVMKANGLSITKIEADLFFQEYIQETIENTKKCYGISDSTPKCMVNVLADILFSNNLECLFAQEITSIVQKNDFSKLKDFIKKQNWCDLHQERCLKAQQTMKSCI
ncbi:hypothetical protein ABPG74_017682 [Tetrahymena malaccensis]